MTETLYTYSTIPLGHSGVPGRIRDGAAKCKSACGTGQAGGRNSESSLHWDLRFAVRPSRILKHIGIVYGVLENACPETVGTAERNRSIHAIVSLIRPDRPCIVEKWASQPQALVPIPE